MLETSLLIIDDIADIRLEMEQMFALLDINATGASSIDEALQILRRHESIAVALCDLTLRGECGADLVARIAADDGLAGRRLAIIFLTGDFEKARAVDPTMGRVLIKPVEPRVLIETVMAAIEDARQERRH